MTGKSKAWEEALREAPDRHVIITEVVRTMVGKPSNRMPRANVTKRSVGYFDDKGVLRINYTEDLTVVTLSVA